MSGNLKETHRLNYSKTKMVLLYGFKSSKLLSDQIICPLAHQAKYLHVRKLSLLLTNNTFLAFSV